MTNSLRNFLICALLLAATLVVYYRAVDNGFVVHYDDGDYITLNPHVQTGLNGRSIAWAFKSVHSANWHPLTWLSHMTDFALYRLTPTGHHLTSILLHAACVLFLFLLLFRLTGAVWRSAFVAALFAVHPLHVESVAWISERKDVLSTLFLMLTLWAYSGYVERPNIKRYLLVMLSFMMGLMSKPMLVTLPLLLLLLDYWPLNRLQFGKARTDGTRVSRLITEKIPLFALSATSCIITFIAQRGSGAVSSLQETTVGVRISNAVVAYVTYIGKMFWPMKLAVLYPHPGYYIPLWQIAGSAVFLAVTTIFCLRVGLTRRYLLAGWLWYIITLIPVIGLIQVGLQAIADRYTYIPLTGLFLIIAWGVPDLLQSMKVWDRWGKIVSAVVSVVVLALLMARAHDQVKYWRNSITLLKHAIAITTYNYAAHNCLGTALVAEGKYKEAIEQYRLGLQIMPNHAPLLNDLGVALASMGRIDEALKHTRKAVDLDPKFDEAHYNLGKILALKKEWADAVKEYKTSLALEPDNADAHNNLGNAYLNMGKLEDAIREYREALRINLNLVNAQANLETALQGRSKDAESFAKSNRHYNAGLELQSISKIDEAINEYQQAIRAQPDLAQAHNNLAVAYFDKGNFVDAWKEVYLCRKYGLEPHPEFVQSLSEEMPDPQQ